MSDQRNEDTATAVALIVLVLALVFLRSCLDFAAQGQRPLTPPESLYR